MRSERQLRDELRRLVDTGGASDAVAALEWVLGDDRRPELFESVETSAAVREPVR
jgi:TnpA family transposase